MKYHIDNSLYEYILRSLLTSGACTWAQKSRWTGLRLSVYHTLYGRLEVVSMQAIFTCIPAINQCMFSDVLIQWCFFSSSCPHEWRRRGLQATVGEEPSDHLLLCSTHCDSWFYCSHILSRSHIWRWAELVVVITMNSLLDHHRELLLVTELDDHLCRGDFSHLKVHGSSMCFSSYMKRLRDISVAIHMWETFLIV